MSKSASCRLRSGWRLNGDVLVFLLVCVFAFSFSAALHAQQAEKIVRKVVTQVEPAYPPDLKRALIGGVVRLDIVVSARGSVEYVQVAGGNPILAEAAAKAVKQWKYTPATASTNIRVNVHFDPTH